MIPYKTIFKINRKNSQPIYIQLTNQFIELIKKEHLLQKQNYLEAEVWRNF